MSLFTQCYEWCNEDGDNDTSYYMKPYPLIHKSEYEEVKEQCLRTGKLYEDPDFPADYTVLHNQSVSAKVEWQRSKEISKKPIFILDGAKYYDVDQGLVGNCWFLAAIGCLLASPYKQLIDRVIPQDQSFGKGYCGAFRFFFYESETWKEVVIDDRLPTINGKLIYASNRKTPNEFWCPLIEKAFAKLRGSYENLQRNFLHEGLKYLTGGVCDFFYLKDITDKNLDEVLTGFNKSGIMGAGIKEISNQPQKELESGLVTGHAYSVINVIQVRTRFGDITLLHMRNPWGKTEWNGPWSDYVPGTCYQRFFAAGVVKHSIMLNQDSEEWNSVSDEDRKWLPKKSDEGEFWISVSDFKQHFDYMVFCILAKEHLTEEVAANVDSRQWNMSKIRGSWVESSSAGGPPVNFFSKRFWQNPQFHFRVANATRPTFVVISLSDVESPNDKHSCDISVGLVIIKVQEGQRLKHITTENCHEFVLECNETSGPHWPYRTRTISYFMEPGDYVIIPCTCTAGHEAQFFLNILSEGDVQVSPLEMNEMIHYPEREATAVKSFSTSSRDLIYPLSTLFSLEFQNMSEVVVDRTFDAVVGKKGLADARDLMEVLKAGMKAAGEEPSCICMEMCHDLTELSNSKSEMGLIDKVHVRKAWSDLEIWRSQSSIKKLDTWGFPGKTKMAKTVAGLSFLTWPRNVKTQHSAALQHRAYRSVDTDGDNLLNDKELMYLLHILDFCNGTEMVNVIIKRYGGKAQRISEEDFLQAFSKALNKKKIYEELKSSKKIDMTLNEWLSVTQKI